MNEPQFISSFHGKEFQAMFQNLLPVLKKIYDPRNINFRFSVLVINFGTQFISETVLPTHVEHLCLSRVNFKF